MGEVFRKFIQQRYGDFMWGVGKVLGLDWAKVLDSLLRFGRRLSLKHPETLADKICAIEVYSDLPLRALCSDKYAVRDYVREKGLEDILIPTVGGPWSTAEAIDFDALPDAFVIKATHGCKMNLLVENKFGLNVPEARQRMNHWLQTAYGRYSMEPHYLKIPPRLYGEMLLRDDVPLKEYKLHCLNGKVQFILVCSQRQVDQSGKMRVVLDSFDSQWHPLDVLRPQGHTRPGKVDIPRPVTLETMCHIAEVLSSDFDFVRVDLYEVKGRVYFGELTFTPGCGVLPYYRRDFLKCMGQRLCVNFGKGKDVCT